MKELTDRSAYSRTIDELMHIRHTVDNMKLHLDIADEVVAEFRSTLPDIQAHCGWSTNSIQGALIHVNNLDDIRQVIPLLKRLRELGFKCRKVEDYPEIKRRSYDCGEIKVLAFLRWEEGATCRFEQVGVKEEPVYKLVCGDKKGDV